LIRDTFENIKTSTAQSLKEILKDWIIFRDGMHKGIILSSPRVEIDLFGIDDAASISKLQGPEYACIWLEEPAPIYERANAGLPKGVFDMAIARAARQTGTQMRVQITQNPADEEHWTAELVDAPEEYMTAETYPGSGEWLTITKKTFRIRRGENKFLNPLARVANMAAFQDDPGKWARYVLGEEAEVVQGKKVTPGYNASIHYCKKVIPPLRGGFMQFWDSYQNPTCIIAQIMPWGQLVIHDVLYDEGIGVVELIEEQVKPLLRTPKYAGKVQGWRLIGDPSMQTPDQSSVNSVTSRIVEEAFNARFEGGPVRWPPRREALNPVFKRLLNGGKPLVYLSASATKLHRALKGGWVYKVDNSNRVIGDLPVKNHHDHPGMAFAYGIAVLFPHEKRPIIKAKPRAEALKRARSYRTDTYKQPSFTGGVYGQV